jgi:hypothetical protein
MAAWHQMTTRRFSNRSAITPAYTVSRTTGTAPTKFTIPRSAAEPVSS